MWKKLKDNWKTYLLAVLAAFVGWLSGDKALEYSSTPGENLPRTEKPAPEPDNTWTVVAWFTADKVINQPGLPSFRYSDNLGRYTVFVDAKKQPTAGQIVRAFGKELNPESVSVEVVSVIPPEGWQEPAPDLPDEDTK